MDPKTQKRPRDTVGNAIAVMKIAVGEADDDSVKSVPPPPPPPSATKSVD